MPVRSIIILILLSMPIVMGAEYSLPWGGEVSLGGKATAIAGVDFNRDGKPDGAVIGTPTETVAVDSSGSELWSMPIGEPEAIIAIDLNADGYSDEVIIAGSRITAVEGGAKKWEKSLRGYSALAVDRNGDGIANDIIIGGWNKIYALDRDGNEIWSYEADGAVKDLAQNYRGFIASAGKNLYALSLGGSTLWSKFLPENIGAIAAIDLDLDRALDGVVAGRIDGNFSVFDEYGTYKYSTYKNMGSSTTILMSNLDKNSDGKLNEVVFGIASGIYVISSDGQQISTQMFSSIADPRSIAPADFDGDGRLDDLVVGKEGETTPGKLYALNAQGTTLAEYAASGASALVAVDLDGNKVMGEVIAASFYDYRVRAVKWTFTDATTAPQTPQPTTTQPPQTTAPPTTTAPAIPPLPQVFKAAVNAGPDQTVAEGTSITLTANATPSSLGSKVVAYLWIENNVVLNTKISERTLSRVFSPGVHNITLRVIDDASATASDDVIVTVTPAAPLPNLSAVDSDGDGLSDEQERILKTNPYNPDTDGDGLTDSVDPNPLVPEKAGPLSGGASGILKWVLVIFAAVGVIAAVLLRGKIQDYFWERDWLK